MEIKPLKFRLACESGLILAGQNEDKEPEWVGNDSQWRQYKIAIENL